MTIQPYVTGFPQDGSSLGSTKTQIRNNLDGTFLTLGVDHVNNNGQPGGNPANAGYHTVIHQQLQSSIPATINGVNQIFSMIPGTAGTPAIPPGGDTQLYTKTGNGGVSQLTGAVRQQNGYTWCAGVLMQWGIVGQTFANSSSVTGTVTFNIPFSIECYNIQFTMLGNSSSGQTIQLCTTSPLPNTVPIPVPNLTRTGFTWQFTSAPNSGSYKGFYWFAIGR